MLGQVGLAQRYNQHRFLFTAMAALLFAFTLLMAQHGVAKADGPDCQVSAPQVSGNSVTVSFTCATGTAYQGGYYNGGVPYNNYWNTGNCWYCNNGYYNTGYYPYYNNGYYPYNYLNTGYYPYYNNGYYPYNYLNTGYYPYYNNGSYPYYNTNYNYNRGYTPCWNGWAYTC